jgi:hypothetical protein
MRDRLRAQRAQGGTFPFIISASSVFSVAMITNRSYAVRVQTDRLCSITAYFACGSMVLFYLFPKNVAL